MNTDSIFGNDPAGADEDLDINYCYKIVLAGMTEQRSRAEILEEIWKYTIFRYV